MSAPAPQARRPFAEGTRLIGPRQALQMASNLVRRRKAFYQARRQGGAQPRALVEAPGRKVGKPEGAHIADMVALRKAIVLCHLRCQSRFDHARAGYYKDRRFPFVTGRCDGCRQHMIQNSLYIHESFLGDPGGRTRSGQVWTPL